MRRFVWGFVLGVSLTLGYYEWERIVWTSRQWFASASSAPEAEEKVDDMFAAGG